MKDKKLLVCISFHFVEERINFLKKVVENFLKYEINTDIIIDTNKSFNFFSEHKNISIIEHNNLGHPFYLTWMHRKNILHKINDYDFFMYIEDDILLPYENFLYYIENFSKLYEIHSVPSFIRLEEKNNELYIVDLVNLQYNRPTIKFENQTFVNLDAPYHGFWILPQKELKESINENFAIQTDSRETAASYVIWTLGKTPYVLLDGKNISKLCWSYHLPNNYTSYEWSPHGKIKYDSVIFNN
jgi:hypothetical protein